MSPSDLSRLQGCLFFLLGVAAAYGLNRCQNRRTNHGTSDDGSVTILTDNGITPTPVDDAQSSESDEDSRPPPNLSNPFGEAMASTGSPSCPDRKRYQIYYDNNRYGNDGYHSPRHGHNYPYAPQETHFDYNQEAEYPSHPISVDILLSSRVFMNNHLITGLQREGLCCEVRGSVITVSGYPTGDGASGFLALVKQISGDRGASIQ